MIMALSSLVPRKQQKKYKKRDAEYNQFAHSHFHVKDFKHKLQFEEN